MSKLTLESITDYLNQTASQKHTSILCADGELHLDYEKLNNIPLCQKFIKLVMEQIYENDDSPDYIIGDVSFIVYFLKLFTDFPIPSREEDGYEIIDTQKAYEMAVLLNLHNNILILPEVKQLKNYIDKQIEFKNAKIIANAGSYSASEEAIETFNFVLNRVLNLINVTMDQIERNGTKLSTILTDDKIAAWLNKLQAYIPAIFNLSNNFVSSANAYSEKEGN